MTINELKKQIDYLYENKLITGEEQVTACTQDAVGWGKITQLTAISFPTTEVDWKEVSEYKQTQLFLVTNLKP